MGQNRLWKQVAQGMVNGCCAWSPMLPTGVSAKGTVIRAVCGCGMATMQAVDDVDFVSNQMDFNQIIDCVKKNIIGREFINLSPSFF